MNLAILEDDIQQYISDHLKTDVTKLILKGSPFKEVPIQDLANQIVAKQKSENKLPTWFINKKTYYPNKVSIEQTSSEITANYKSKIVSGNTIIDITGGFGVDCYYFSKSFNAVIHCEINETLSKIVTYNFEKLNVSSIKTHAGNGFDYLKNTTEDFDCIYIDPSRRSDVKGKVFLLKDCLPYVPPKLDFFFTKAKHILVKVSPLLDISQTINDLKNVKEVHIVAVRNEVKELLFLLEKGFTAKVIIKTVNFQKEKVQQLNFAFQEDTYSDYEMPLTYLYEPNSAILKSGCFQQISKKTNTFKLHQHSHLFTAQQLLDFPGKRFKIDTVVKYDKKELKKLIPNQKANFTIRNFPKTVAQLRKETKIKDGGHIYVFFTRNKKNKLISIICSKV
ncbi:class I SAM-dependent methyltransferase [Polaribacter sp.]|uniref:class I SAM-dependent methyltransferase n=1 Tax=Polaribacter sp. TaxID=1920175 RepID=UPI0025D1D6A8|nr:class I SAM-dependent methyltransferase [Polaribacter sp.]